MNSVIVLYFDSMSQINKLPVKFKYSSLILIPHYLLVQLHLEWIRCERRVKELDLQFISPAKKIM